MLGQLPDPGSSSRSARAEGRHEVGHCLPQALPSWDLSQSSAGRELLQQDAALCPESLLESLSSDSPCVRSPWQERPEAQTSDRRLPQLEPAVTDATAVSLWDSRLLVELRLRPAGAMPRSLCQE